MDEAYTILSSISTVKDLKKYLSLLDDDMPLSGRFYKQGKETNKEKIESYTFSFTIFDKKEK